MNDFEIVPATVELARQLAPNLREVDIAECYAAEGVDAEAALVDSVLTSDEDMRWAALYRGEPVALFGSGHLADNVGSIWLLASEGIYKNKKDFMRRCYEFLEVMHSRYDVLTNFIDSRNDVTISWLFRLGFIAREYLPYYGHSRLPFIRFTSTRGAADV